MTGIIKPTEKMTTDQWVKRLNALARQIDDVSDTCGRHGVAYDLTRDLRKEYRELAQQETLL